MERHVDGLLARQKPKLTQLLTYAPSAGLAILGETAPTDKRQAQTGTMKRSHRLWVGMQFQGQPCTIRPEQ